MESKEIWKPVVGYEAYLEISNLGNVRSIDRIVIASDGREMHYKWEYAENKEINVA